MDPKHPDSGRRDITSIDKGEGRDVESVTGDRGGVEEVDSGAPNAGVEQTRTGGTSTPDSVADDDDRGGVEGI